MFRSHLTSFWLMNKPLLPWHRSQRFLTIVLQLASESHHAFTRCLGIRWEVWYNSRTLRLLPSFSHCRGAHIRKASHSIWRWVILSMHKYKRRVPLIASFADHTFSISNSGSRQAGSRWTKNIVHYCNWLCLVQRLLHQKCPASNFATLVSWASRFTTTHFLFSWWSGNVFLPHLALWNSQSVGQN